MILTVLARAARNWLPLLIGAHSSRMPTVNCLWPLCVPETCVGGGDWAEDRIVPDAVRALYKGDDLIVRDPELCVPGNMSLSQYLAT